MVGLGELENHKWVTGVGPGKDWEYWEHWEEHLSGSQWAWTGESGLELLGDVAGEGLGETLGELGALWGRI